MTGPESLTATVGRGARALAIRQILGLGLGLVGVLALTRLIGPSSYGLYAAAFGITFLAQTVGELSLDVFLVRRSGELPARLAHQVFTLLLVLGFSTTAVLVVLLAPISARVDLAGFTPVALVMFCSVLLVHLQQVPLSLLERRIDYATIGLVELAGQVVFVVVSVTAALLRAGVWAPVAGWYAQQIVLLGGYWARGGYRPTLVWRSTDLAEALRFGVVGTASSSAYSVRNLVAPLLVGATLGATALGYLSLANRLIDQAGFAARVVGRLSYAVLGRVANDAARLRDAVTRGMEAQVLAVGVPLVGLAVVAPWLVPLAFGTEWTQVARLVPLLTPPFLVTVAFQIPVAALVGHRGRWQLVVVNLVNAAILWSASLALLPRLGLTGFAVAETATIASWVLMAVLYRRSLRSPDYRYVILWCVGASLVCVGLVSIWWVSVLGAALLFSPPSVRRAWATLSPFLSRSGLRSV